MNEDVLSRLYLKDTAFQDLMQKRIFNVLLIASPYDAFMMEEDGRVEEQLYFEYVSLNLSSPPRVTRVSGLDEALILLEEKHYDLVITMPGSDIAETLDDARIIKAAHPGLPIVLLTPFSKKVSTRLSQQDLTGIDYVFSWLGNVDLLLAIIKLLEDFLNAPGDIEGVGVQMIMLVEDSVRFYSSVLPHIYKYLLKQSMEFSTEALNEHEQMLRMRGRPKVMLARDYEEAVELYNRYGNNILGVISDVSFKRQGEKDSKAGFKLAEYLHQHDPFLPIIIESSEPDNEQQAHNLGCPFLDKNSKKLPVDLGKAISEHFGFGDFIIKDPKTGKEIVRLRNLKDLQNRIFDIPDDALFHHASTNDISRWLYSRAMFPLADIIRQHRFTSIEDAPSARQLFFDLIVKYRKMKNRGVVAVYKQDRFDRYSNFARIGEGSLGGKGRGLAFIDTIIKKNPVCDNFHGITISIPRTVVLCTDIFDRFMADGDLYPIALSDAPDTQILNAFLNAKLPGDLIDDLLALFKVVDRPLAVRSSSLLEDSHYQPFAGVYSTYMIPHLDNPQEMLNLLSQAIKGVYASVFFSDSKAYMTATSNVIDQEKMAIIIQEVIGDYHDNYYYPTFSGVARSLNYYPLGNESPSDGVAEIAVGLGKYIVDGGLSLRFSPRHPDHVLQTSELSLALKDTQTRLYALDLKALSGNNPQPFNVDDSFNIARISVQDAAKTGALKFTTSTFDYRDNRLVDYEMPDGRQIVTFNNVLKHNVYPLAPAIDFMLTTGQKAMARPVEIEFAGTINADAATSKEDRGHLYWLQIRPIVDRREIVDTHLLDLPVDKLIIKSCNALGHGNIEGVYTIVYVKPDTFNSAASAKIGNEIEKINRQLLVKNIPYILIGPGRWGSSDSALGIPVKWPHISGAKLIVETTLKGYRIEPSQGTHFFQNLTSLGVGYFTIDPSAPDGRGGYIDMGLLDRLPATIETEHVKVVTFTSQLIIAINGLTSSGIVAPPPTNY